MKKMKWIVLILGVLMMTGCAKISDISRAERMHNWSFDYNEEDGDYSVFFGIEDKDEQPIAENADVNIRIENEGGEEVYSEVKSVSVEDFQYHTSHLSGEQYLAEVRIPKEDIKKSKYSNGNVYLKIRNSEGDELEEVSCSAIYCLPVLDVELEADEFPAEFDVQNMDGSIQSTLRLDRIEYSYKSGILPAINLTLYGCKIYGGRELSYDAVNYTVYDSEDQEVDSGAVYLDAMHTGDHFIKDSVMLYGIEPGNKYKIVFSEYSM